MHAEERHQAILRRLRERGSLRVTDFAHEVRVSPVTIRRDVEQLAERGLLARVHGGAVLSGADAAAAPHEELVFGLLVPAADHYYPEVIKGAREAAAERGVRLVLGISQYSREQERTQLRRMLADGVDGLLITPCGSLDETELPVPYVLVERRPADDLSRAEHVATDHAYGAGLAVRHLAGPAGRRRVGLVVRDDGPHAAAVRDGYHRGLAAAGLTAPDGGVLHLAPPADEDAGREGQLAAFTEAVTGGALDGVLVHNDHDALVLLQRLRAHGVDVPGDLAVVAYDDEVAALADIPLTAVAPPKHAMGAAAVGLLTRRVSDPAAPRHRLTLLPELHVRASTGVD
ncbi:substrate-binding domain-containing protein [Streptomyces sp. NRRL S-118]|uniref:substrate-binding domain-containing protein n=1 Tax=Streptomyces sp. NRRL S-118 TaxID=1463881 RepID=UPI0004CB5E40|nr:DeoR/GlpR family transcriptional regulator [Streptomyces sp. NRRL S-118]